MTDDIDRSFDWYKSALAGKREALVPDGNPKAGFYRIKNADESHSAAAYWYDATDPGHGLRCHIDGKDIPAEQAHAQWPFASKGPIPEDVYWHWLDTHTWLDIDPEDMKRKAIVIGVDVDKAFEQFKGATDVRYMLMKLAQDAVNKGREVPGAVLEWREVIRRGKIPKLGASDGAQTRIEEQNQG